MAIDPIAVWANMTLKTWPERYWMLGLDDAHAEIAAVAVANSEARYACLIRDQSGLSLLADDRAARRLASEIPVRERFGPFRVVSTDGDLPFDVIGFMAPALKALTEAGIKAGPQCGAVFDHLFIYERDIDRAQATLDAFIADARARR